MIHVNRLCMMVDCDQSTIAHLHSIGKTQELGACVVHVLRRKLPDQKLVPTWWDKECLIQLLPRSVTITAEVYRQQLVLIKFPFFREICSISERERNSASCSLSHCFFLRTHISTLIKYHRIRTIIFLLKPSLCSSNQSL